MDDKHQESNKKCFCTRCFLPIAEDEKVDIEGQSFHRFCSMCCICHTIPTSLKMFYGHVFCANCFKTHIQSRFKGDARVYSNSWWMQGGMPGQKPDQTPKEENVSSDSSQKPPEVDPPKKCICARCLSAIDNDDKVKIGAQVFHTQCAKCYFCHTVPKNLKIYYGQVFCEECFYRHVMNRDKDNPSEFFKFCFDQWQNNAQFSDYMKDFMTSSNDCSPFLFMMGQPHPPFCRCGSRPPNPEWTQGNTEPKKSATKLAGDEAESISTWELSFENRTDDSFTSEPPDTPNILEESANENFTVAVAEKIEKLTKYLHNFETEDDYDNHKIKWKNINENYTKSLSEYGWVDLQSRKTVKSDKMICPPCLWQCGPIYVDRKYLQKEVCCETQG